MDKIEVRWSVIVLAMFILGMAMLFAGCVSREKYLKDLGERDAKYEKNDKECIETMRLQYLKIEDLQERLAKCDALDVKP